MTNLDDLLGVFADHERCVNDPLCQARSDGMAYIAGKGFVPVCFDCARLAGMELIEWNLWTGDGPE